MEREKKQIEDELIPGLYRELELLKLKVTKNEAAWKAAIKKPTSSTEKEGYKKKLKDMIKTDYTKIKKSIELLIDDVLEYRDGETDNENDDEECETFFDAWTWTPFDYEAAEAAGDSQSKKALEEKRDHLRLGPSPSASSSARP